jgi:TRAP-type C4-dicarboxylate transport system substrate-binding protein
MRILTMILVGTLIAANVLTCGAMAQGPQPIVMRLSTATLNDPQHEWLNRFAAAIGKNTNGRIKAEVFPASQLGSIPRQIEGTQMGAIQGWVGPPEFLVGVDHRFETLSAPGLFKDEKQAFKVFDDARFEKMFLSMAENKGLTGVALFYVGPSSYDMRVPVQHVADLKNKKIRVLASQLQTEPLARLGATGVPLSLGDVLPALQQGTIDGAQGAVSVFTALKYYDAAKYMFETRHVYFYSIAMLSRRWFDKLPPELQRQILDASKQVTNEILPYSLDFLDRQRKAWVAHGGQLIELSDAERAALDQKTRSVGDDIVKQHPEMRQVWDMLGAITNR